MDLLRVSLKKWLLNKPSTGENDCHAVKANYKNQTLKITPCFDCQDIYSAKRTKIAAKGMSIGPRKPIRTHLQEMRRGLANSQPAWMRESIPCTAIGFICEYFFHNQAVKDPVAIHEGREDPVKFHVLLALRLRS